MLQVQLMHYHILNNAQKADVKSKINVASNIAGVNTVKQQGQI